MRFDFMKMPGNKDNPTRAGIPEHEDATGLEERQESGPTRSTGLAFPLESPGKTMWKRNCTAAQARSMYHRSRHGYLAGVSDAAQARREAPVANFIERRRS